MPKGVIKKIVSIQTRFLWGVYREGKNFLDELEKSMCSKSHGRLGIKDLGMFNESLVAKWRWNLVHTKDSL